VGAAVATIVASRAATKSDNYLECEYRGPVGDEMGWEGTYEKCSHDAKHLKLAPRSSIARNGYVAFYVWSSFGWCFFARIPVWLDGHF